MADNGTVFPLISEVKMQQFHIYNAMQYMVAMVVMQHAIYRALDCFDLPTHWATKILGAGPLGGVSVQR